MNEKNQCFEAAMLCASLLLSVGCGGDDTEPAANAGGTSGATGSTSGATGGTGGTTGGPLYYIATEVYTADFDSSTSFVAPMSSLEVDEVDLSQAREYSGRATLAAIGEWLFVMDGGEPVVERFAVGDDGSLTSEGRLSFANYSLSSWSLDVFGNTIISSTKSYLGNPDDGSLIVWNPTTMEITGEIQTPGLAKEGLSVEFSPGVLNGNRLMRTITWLSYEDFDFSVEPVQLAIYDVENDTVVSQVDDARCPALYSVPFATEDGDTYFSNHVWSPMETLLEDAPASCALRVLSGETTFDPDWQLTYADVADGRQGGVMRYLGDGQVLVDTFYDENVEIDPETDGYELGQSSNWRLWMVDLERGTGGPVDGLPFRPGGYNDVHLDGRTLILLGEDGYTRTSVYEILDGEFAKVFGLQGLSYHMVKLR